MHNHLTPLRTLMIKATSKLSPVMLGQQQDLALKAQLLKQVAVERLLSMRERLRPFSAKAHHRLMPAIERGHLPQL